MVRAFKKVNRFLLFITASLFITIGQANAGLIPTGVGNVLLDIDTSGAEPSLLGARNIDVFGTGELYDVSFVTGTFLDIFGGESGLDTLEENSARAFSQALLDFVFVDLPEGSFDAVPRQTFGCETDFSCVIFTPFSFGPLPFSIESTDFFDAFAVVNEVGAPGPFGFDFDFIFDAGARRSSFATDTNEVFADFSLSSTAPTQDVPEPPTLAFMLLTLVYLVWNNYKRT